MHWRQSDNPQTSLDERIERLQKRQAWKKQALKLLLPCLIVWLLFGKIFGIAIVRGNSMDPAVKQNDLVFFFRLAREYKAGDIVLLDAEEKADYIKRIAGLPGQTVDFDESRGELLIDGKPLPEPYIYEESYGKKDVTYPLTVGDAEYFLLGDHRSNSLDSRNFGTVPKKQLDGRVLALLRFGSGAPTVVELSGR